MELGGMISSANMSSSSTIRLYSTVATMAELWICSAYRDLTLLELHADTDIYSRDWLAHGK